MRIRRDAPGTGPVARVDCQSGVTMMLNRTSVPLTHQDSSNLCEYVFWVLFSPSNRSVHLF